MKRRYSPATPINSIKSVKYSDEGFEYEFRTDGEVGYTVWGENIRPLTKEKKRNHHFDRSPCEEHYEDDRRFWLTDLKTAASFAAIDIHLFSEGRKEESFGGDYVALRNIIKIIQTNIIPGKDIDNTTPDYMSKEFKALIIVAGRNSEKERPLKVARWLSERQWDDCFSQITNSDAMLELRLLYMELRDFESLPKERLETLMDFCVDFSNELDGVRAFEKRYVA